jgi:hypothetical protein
MCICFQAVVSGSTKSKGSRNVNPKNIAPALRNATNLQRHPLGDISNVDMHSQRVTGTELFSALRFTTLSCIGLPCFGYVFNLIEHVFAFKQWSQQAANQKDLAMRIQKTSHPHRGMQQICNDTLLVMSLMLTCIPKWVHVCYPVSYVPCESPPYRMCSVFYLIKHVYLLFVSAQACSTSPMDPAWKRCCVDRQTPTHPLLVMSSMLIRRPR